MRYDPDLGFLGLEHTASASEILASAIQDSGAGILMGKDTYGKAVIQSPYYLNNGMVLKLTIAATQLKMSSVPWKRSPSMHRAPVC